MIPALVVGVGIAYLFLREGRSKPQDDQEDEPLPGGSGEEEGIPTPPQLDPLDPRSSWVIEGTVPGYDENVVWLASFQDFAGLPDGDFIMIGNKAHTSFLRSNSDRGTIDIPKEATGGSTDQENVNVYPDLATAQARLEKLANPEPPTPGSPQTEPEDDDTEPTRPSLPTRPDYGLGGGVGSLFSNGGL
jgi:hypothetical protein